MTLTEFKKTADKLYFGLDFGPFVLTRAQGLNCTMTRAHKRIYILDEIYERGLTNTALAPVLRDFCGSQYITVIQRSLRASKNCKTWAFRVRALKKGWTASCTVSSGSRA